MTVPIVRTNRRVRGLSVVDALVGLVIMALGALSLTALMPAFSRSHHMSDEMSKAAQIASRQIEQLRSVGYENLEYPILKSLGLLDEWSGTGPYTFSVISPDHSLRLSAATALHNGVGEVEIYDATDDLREIIVRVNWTSKGGKPRTVQLATLIGTD